MDETYQSPKDIRDVITSEIFSRLPDNVTQHAIAFTLANSMATIMLEKVVKGERQRDHAVKEGVDFINRVSHKLDVFQAIFSSGFCTGSQFMLKWEGYANMNGLTKGSTCLWSWICINL